MDDFWLLLLKESRHPTVEAMEADLDAHEAEIDASLPELHKELAALLG